MKVTFSKIHAKRYAISIEGPHIDPVIMNPAPGYDDRLPHDAAHFIVENELGILGGVFGQVAAGGTANTFISTVSKYPRKARKRGAEIAKANKADALFSEHAVWAAQSRWEKQDIIPDTKISDIAIARIIEKFDEFAEEWSKLPVGGSIALEWKHSPKKIARRPHF